MGKSILVIEDNGEEQKIFSDYLGFVGGRVRVASTGKEGLRLAREVRPDVILLDLRLPGMDGWEVLRRLRDDTRTSEIPVIAVTALQLPPGRVAAAGFQAYLHKPVTPHRILAAVERCIGRVPTVGRSSDSESPTDSPRPTPERIGVWKSEYPLFPSPRFEEPLGLPERVHAHDRRRDD